MEPNDSNGLGLFDVSPPREGGSGRTNACGLTLNKPPGTKPRNAAGRVRWAMAYGVLTFAPMAELADDVRVEASPMPLALPIALNEVMNASPRGGKFWRFCGEQQQTTLGTGNPEAD